MSHPVRLIKGFACLLPLCASVALAQTTGTTSSGTAATSSSSSGSAASGTSSTKSSSSVPETAKPVETTKTRENLSTPEPAKTSDKASATDVTSTSSPDTGPKLPPKGAAVAPPTETTEGKTPETKPAETKPPEAPSPEAAAGAAAQGLGETTQGLVPPASTVDTIDRATLLKNRISLDLRTIDVMDALKFLATKANLNVVGSAGIAGPVTILLNDVSVEDAIDIILSANRFAYAIKGTVMKVMTEEEYKALFGREFYDQRQTKIVQLKYASTKNVGAMLENVKSAVGRIVFNEATGTVVITDTPEKIAEMEEIIRHEELPTIVRVSPTVSEIFDLQYSKAKDVSEKLTSSLTKDLGKIYVDDRVNRLIVSDLPYKIEDIRKLIRAFDTRTREVFIEAKIVQVVLNDRFQGGIDWASIAGGHFQQTFPLNLTSFGQMTLGTIAPTTTTNVDGSTSTTFSGGGMILQFLETFGKTNVLSTPQIAVVNGEEAKIMVGSKEAYTTSSVTQSQATTTTAQQVTFVDVGVTLKVTPTINADGMITMKIKPEVSSVSRFVTTAQGDQIPIVESTNAETTVMVRDGATVLIGGLMATSQAKQRSGLPVLSRIPVVGALFRSTDDRAVNSELSILLTPHIMSGEETFPGALPVAEARVTIPPAGGMSTETPGGMAGGATPATTGTPGKKAPAKRHSWRRQ